MTMKCTFVIMLCIILSSFSQLPPSPPIFSWDTVPLFMHAGNTSGPLNETAAKYMSSFPLVTTNAETGNNGSHAPCGNMEICEEDRIISALQQIRSYNNQTRTLFYLNSVLLFPPYRLYNNFIGENEKYLLHDKNGNLIYLKQCKSKSPNYTVFDLSQSKTRLFWLNTVKYALTKYKGVVDGIFADRANNQSHSVQLCNITQSKYNKWNLGHELMLQEAMDLVYSINSERGIIIGNNADIGIVNGRMFEMFETYNYNTGQNLKQLMNENGKRITEVHEDQCTFYSAKYNQSLAAYLIASYKYSYYGCTQGFTLQKGWDIIWQNQDYFKPLGEPLMNATFDNNTQIYHRKFGKGVNVWLDSQWLKPCILWSDGSITGNKIDCDTYNMKRSNT
eukprot:415640_1